MDSNKKTTRIAIALATYNSEKYLREQIDSLLAQTYDNFVCYIHDDGSTDKTKDIIKYYSEIYNDKIVVLNYPKIGSAKGNFISIMKYIQEPYLMFCDHDDVWLPDKIQNSWLKIQELEKQYSGSPILVFTDQILVDEYLNITHASLFKYKHHNPYKSLKLSNLLIENCGAGCTMIMNKKVYETAIKVQNVSNIIMHDYWVALVASCIGHIGYLNMQTMLYRQHIDNVWGVKDYKNFLRKVLDKLRELFNKDIDNFIIKRNKWLQELKMQALELVNIDDIPYKAKQMAYDFANIKNKSKFHRIIFLMKNHIRKEHDNFWLYIWI